MSIVIIHQGAARSPHHTPSHRTPLTPAHRPLDRRQCPSRPPESLPESLPVPRPLSPATDPTRCTTPCKSSGVLLTPTPRAHSTSKTWRVDVQLLSGGGRGVRRYGGYVCVGGGGVRYVAWREARGSSWSGWAWGGEGWGPDLGAGDHACTSEAASLGVTRASDATAETTSSVVASPSFLSSWATLWPSTSLVRESG